MRTDGLGGLRAGAHNKKPRVMRGSKRLTTQLSELAGLVLPCQMRFETLVRTQFMRKTFLAQHTNNPLK